MNGKDTALEPDGLRNSHFMQLCEEEVKELSRVFNESLESGTIPTHSLDSHLAQVPKPDIGSTKIAAYRIITMQNTIGKLPDKRFATRI